jgi:hypothetical protein
MQFELGNNFRLTFSISFLSNFAIELKMPCIVTCGRSFLKEPLDFEDGTNLPPKVYSLPTPQISQLEPAKDSFYQKFVRVFSRLASRLEGNRDIYNTKLELRRMM